ncbi:MAG: alpha/beta fold hydrolase [Candidatus Marsarchaeota archaeon]|jgi:alpha-beta hydrolase superfamily lysophospholipase|nr:alpha/beta fold hydrolase [Candidatus Marsarchaeota archaeon]
MYKNTILKGELISFATEDRIPLHGFLVRNNTKKCIISVHGMGGNFYNSTRLAYFTKTLKGFSIFSINTRGHDELSSTKKINGKKWIYTGTGTERFEDCVYDISAAISMLWGMGFRQFVLMGHSTGCQKIAYYQYKRNDKRVKAMVLLGPADDYGLRKADKTEFRRAMSMVHSLEKIGKADIPVQELGFFSAKRTLSVSDLRNAEARMFYYDGKLAEFSRIRVPICAVFGSDEEYRDRPVDEYLDILSKNTHSKNYRSIIIYGAGHSFAGYEEETAKSVGKWLDEVVR